MPCSVLNPADVVRTAEMHRQADTGKTHRQADTGKTHRQADAGKTHGQVDAGRQAGTDGCWKGSKAGRQAGTHAHAWRHRLMRPIHKGSVHLARAPPPSTLVRAPAPALARVTAPWTRCSTGNPSVHTPHPTQRTHARVCITHTGTRARTHTRAHAHAHTGTHRRIQAHTGICPCTHPGCPLW